MSQISQPGYAHHRLVTWGDALLAQATKSEGGLKAAVERIRGAVGPQIGVRNSFAKLYATEDPAALRNVDKWRAWLLLTAIGEDPERWEITADVVPDIHMDRLDTLRRFLTKPKPSDYKAPVRALGRPANRSDRNGRPSNRSR